MRNLYCILVPTERPHKYECFSIEHHKEFDEFVVSVSRGITILNSAKGQWIDNSTKLYEEKMIPVLIYCEKDEMLDIANFAKQHYEQYEIMFWKVSEEVNFI